MEEELVLINRQHFAIQLMQPGLCGDNAQSNHETGQHSKVTNQCQGGD